MDHSPTFGRFFARLVGLLIHEPASVDEQKVVLRAAVAMGRQGAVRLTVRDGRLLADDEPMLAGLPGVQDTIERMRWAELGELAFEAGSSPAEILARARALAAGTPAPAAAPAPAAEPAPALVSDDANAMYYQFSVIGTVKDSPEALLAKLDAAANSAEAVRVLDDAVTLAETAAREGRSADVADLMAGVVERERGAPDEEYARAYVMALRRMAKPVMLRAVSALVPGDAGRRERIGSLLVRMGQDGAEAVIDQYVQAQTADDRRVLFEVLRPLEATVPALIHMLGDARWFVARNAADLLGELHAAAAESALIGCMRHGDDRVRRSATNALMQLGTESGRQAVRSAVRDAAPQVRMQAAFAIAENRDPQTATTLITAMDAEADSDVQLAMLLALGRVGTADAVQRLIRAAEPERGLFRKKSTAFRVAAVQALAEAKSAAAQAALRALASDKEREVRDTVARLTQQRGRRG